MHDKKHVNHAPCLHSLPKSKNTVHIVCWYTQCYIKHECKVTDTNSKLSTWEGTFPKFHATVQVHINVTYTVAFISTSKCNKHEARLWDIRSTHTIDLGISFNMQRLVSNTQPAVRLINEALVSSQNASSSTRTGAEVRLRSWSQKSLPPTNVNTVPVIAYITHCSVIKMLGRLRGLVILCQQTFEEVHIRKLKHIHQIAAGWDCNGISHTLSPSIGPFTLERSQSKLNLESLQLNRLREHSHTSS